MEEKRPRVGSATIVIHEEKILLGKRNKKNANGLWVIPGGRVDYGERIKDAAVRETKEETNLDVEIIKFVGYKEIIATHVDYHAIVFFYLAKPKHLKLEAREDLSEAKFFSIEEIKKLDKVESVEWALKEAGLWN